MKISQELINDIRESADIVEVISHYIPLSKRGKNYSAVCPFHDDHDPSLYISQDKQIYKCFVCGNGGNVFSFVSNYKKISFPEAVAEVGNLIGKPVEIEKSVKPVSKYQKYYDLLQSMIAYSQYLLSGSKLGEQAMNYLNNRGLDKQLCEYFNVGYNPANNRIYDYLKNQNFADEDMIKTGICRMLDKGMSDVFYDRILFPIHDFQGNPIGFTARDFKGNSQSKYINSSDNIIYNKGDNLYNYHRSKQAARKASYILVCEGVMDVIAYYRAGKENAVATLGTACTNKQIELLKSLSNHIVLSYDGDTAGQKANLKIGEMLLKQGLKVSVIDNDTGLDPDEIVNKDKNALRELESRQISYIDYVMKYYRKHYNLDNFNDRKKIMELVSPLIDELTDVYERDNYYNELYELTKIHKRQNNIETKKEYNSKVTVPNYSIDGLTKAEYIILVQMALSKKALDIYQKHLGYLVDKTSTKLAMLIVDDYRKNKSCSLTRLYDEVNDNEIRDLISNFALMEGLPEEFDENLLLGAITKIKLEIKKQKMEELRKNIEKYSLIDQEKTQEYLNEYEKLIREIGGSHGKRN